MYKNTRSYYWYQKFLVDTFTYVLATDPVLMYGLDLHFPQDLHCMHDTILVYWYMPGYHHQCRVRSKYVCDCVYKDFLQYTLYVPNFLRRWYCNNFLIIVGMVWYIFLHHILVFILLYLVALISVATATETVCLYRHNTIWIGN